MKPPISKTFSKSGQMTVNFKINVQTSGPHDGLLLTTGIQTNGTNLNFEDFGSIPWWKAMSSISKNSLNEILNLNSEKNNNINKMPAILGSANTSAESIKENFQKPMVYLGNMAAEKGIETNFQSVNL